METERGGKLLLNQQAAVDSISAIMISLPQFHRPTAAMMPFCLNSEVHLSAFCSIPFSRFPDIFDPFLSLQSQFHWLQMKIIFLVTFSLNYDSQETIPAAIRGK
jgi:hypothetical protein